MDASGQYREYAPTPAPRVKDRPENARTDLTDATDEGSAEPTIDPVENGVTSAQTTQADPPQEPVTETESSDGAPEEEAPEEETPEEEAPEPEAAEEGPPEEPAEEKPAGEEPAEQEAPEGAAAEPDEGAEEEPAAEGAAAEEAVAPQAPEPDRFVSPVDLLTASELLRTEIAALSLRLEVPGVPRARTERQGLLRQMDDFLLPRLRRRDAPLLAVIGGSTGAGKSTLTNSLLGRVVSRSGVLRPTTRSPVLVHHPFDSGAFLSQRVLPGLARVTSEAPEPVQPVDVDAPRVTALRLVPDEGLAPGLAVVDAPDIDSVVEANRDLAVQLLAAADLWIFVTTAARYADAVPWEMLQQAVERGISVAVVLDRVPPATMSEVRVHLATMLSRRGLGNAPLFTIPETRIIDGFLPPEVVTPLLAWLTRLARDRSARDVVLRRTLEGALSSLPSRVLSLADAADEQARAHAVMQAQLDAAYTAAATGLDTDLADGSVLQGEVLVRWQEFLGGGEVLRNVDSAVARARERLSAVLGPGTTPSQEIGQALRTSLRAVVRARLLAALEQSTSAWREQPAGNGLLAAREDLESVAADLDDRLERQVEEWHAGVRDAVGSQIQSLRTPGRAVSLGVDEVGMMLELAALSQQADRSGSAPAAGAVTIAHRLLDAVLGQQAVRSLAAAALDDARERLTALVQTERGRLQVLLDSAGVQTGSGGGLRSAVSAVQGSR